MRKSTFLWLSLAAFCGASLFHTSQNVHDKRAELAKLTQTIAQEEESLRVLRAEWGYLNRPARLEKLAGEHLALSPLKGAQFTRLENIPLRGAEPLPEVKAETPPEITQAPPPRIVAPKPTPPKPKTKPKAAADARSMTDLIKSLGVVP